MTDVSILEDKLADAVRRAAGEMKAGFEITAKDSVVNIVTSSDLAVERALYASLGKLLPEAGFLSEETEKTADREYMWIIDPIDGTTNYARGMDDCAISVGLVKGGVPALSAVYMPRKGLMFTAAAGKGARLNGKPIRVSDKPFEKAILCTAMSLYKKELAPVCMDIISEAYAACADFRRFGSAATELCYIAAGLCDLYFEIRIFPWDYAGAWLVLKEAGGVIKGLKDAELTFNRPAVVVAANSEQNYERLSAIVNKHIRSTPYDETLYKK